MMTRPIAEMAKTLTLIGMIPVVIILVVVFIKVVGPVWRGARTQRELDVIGVPAQAKVLSVKDTGLRVSTFPVIALEVEVHPANGFPYQAKLQSAVGLVELARYQPGLMVAVKVDPKDPQRLVLDRPR